MKVVILAAGEAKRMGKIHIPKCLMKVWGKTLLESQIDTLIEHGLKDIRIVIGEKGRCWTKKNQKEVEKILPNIIINHNNTATQNSFSLSLGLKDIKRGPVLVIDGDIGFTKEVISKMINLEYETFIVTKMTKSPFEPGSKVVTRGNIVTNIGKTIKPIRFPWHIYAGLMKIGNNLFDVFKEALSNKRYYSEDIGHPLQMLCKKYEIYNITINTGWININTKEELNKAKRILLK